MLLDGIVWVADWNGKHLEARVMVYQHRLGPFSGHMWSIDV